MISCINNGCKDIKHNTTKIISLTNIKNSIIDPLVSIIVPSYNALEQLKTCVLSIQKQSFTNYEVLIIDGNSKDETLQFLQTLKPPFRYVSEGDQNVYDAMNKGVNMANGQWVYFMGSDDQLINTDVLSTVFNHPFDSEIDLVIGNIKYDCSTQQARHLNKDDDIRKSNWSSQLWLTNSVHHQGVFYRRSVIEKMAYNLNYKILADYDLNLKLFRQGKRAKMINQVVALCGANGMSKQYKWSMYKEEIQLKTKQTSIWMRPLFYALAFLKYLLKRIQS